MRILTQIEFYTRGLSSPPSSSVAPHGEFAKVNQSSGSMPLERRLLQVAQRELRDWSPLKPSIEFSESCVSCSRRTANKKLDREDEAQRPGSRRMRALGFARFGRRCLCKLATLSLNLITTRPKNTNRPPTINESLSRTQRY